MKFTCTVRGKILLDAYKTWIKNNSSVLDVGCGDGSMGKMIGDEFKCEIQGTDIMDFVKGRIPFKIMSSETKLPYRNKEFDFAMLNDMLHHTRKQKEILLEALRVADNVLIFDTRPTFSAKVLDHVLNWQHNVKMPIPLTHRTPEGWKSLFEKMGLKSEYREPEHSFMYPVSHFAFRVWKK
ncbi:MAG: methyltransferase domain-containing protein [Candidatus Aenigmarchaeota archaeon]|nr:methyltransferase domain-containing protein [Candidatus Aenigmarchaeota archaeon]